MTFLDWNGLTENHQGAKEGVLKVEVYTRYEISRSENEGESHGEEAQFTYYGNMKVEGSKLLLLVDGKSEEGHRTW